MTQLSRRALITGLFSLVAAPAIVRVASIMPVRVMETDDWRPFNDVFDFGSTSGENTSIWRVLWGREPIFQMFPGPVHYVSRLADIGVPAGPPPDLFKMLGAA